MSKKNYYAGGFGFVEQFTFELSREYNIYVVIIFIKIVKQLPTL